MASLNPSQARRAQPRPKPRPRPSGAQNRRPAIDFATLLGVTGGFVMIGLAIYLGGSLGTFINWPGLLIVLGGTFLVTTVSFTLKEVIRAQRLMVRAVIYHSEEPEQAAHAVLELAEQARRRGVLDLQNKLPGLIPGSFAHRAMTLVVDGLPEDEIARMLDIEVRETASRHQRSAGVLRRAGEVAPAMGLIGTLVGLVQMLGNLEDPSAIGPAMAVALLTTFYGAILANMVFNPLAGKLERNSELETLVNHIYAVGAAGITRQENPRRLEMVINTVLAPTARVRHFD